MMQRYVAHQHWLILEGGGLVIPLRPWRCGHPPQPLNVTQGQRGQRWQGDPK